MSKEVIAQLISKNEAHLAHKEKLTANIDARQWCLRSIGALGTFIALGGFYFRPKPTEEEKLIMEKYDNELSKLQQKCDNELNKFQQKSERVFSIMIAALLITGTGALIDASISDGRRVDIDSAKANIKHLKAVLAILQTETPSSPEAAVEA